MKSNPITGRGLFKRQPESQRQSIIAVARVAIIPKAHPYAQVPVEPVDGATAPVPENSFQQARPLDYRPVAELFARRRIVSASSSNCLLWSRSARYFPDSSWVASSTSSPLRS